MSGYCDIAPGHPWHGPYHATEYGFPLNEDQALFERLCLEIFQAGLSWLIVLKRRAGMKAGFDGFDPVKVAAYGEADIERLMNDPAVIRYRAKIVAIIENAKIVLKLAAEHGSFANWIAANHPLSKEAWVKLFRKTFRFTGPEVVNEFLMSISYLPGAHRADCPVMDAIRKLNPPCGG